MNVKQLLDLVLGLYVLLGFTSLRTADKTVSFNATYRKANTWNSICL